MNSTTCPQEIRAKNRRSALRKLWASPEWIAAKKAFLKNHPVCDWCGKTAVLPHHVTDETYGTPEYLNLEAHCIPMCYICHQKGGQQLVICPVCRKHYMKRSSDRCRYCRPAADVEKARLEREAHKAQVLETKRAASKRYGKLTRQNKHSCDWRGGGQRCGDPLRHDKVCPYSSAKAKDNCEHFMARKTRMVKK